MVANFSTGEAIHLTAIELNNRNKEEIEYH